MIEYDKFVYETALAGSVHQPSYEIEFITQDCAYSIIEDSNQETF